MVGGAPDLHSAAIGAGTTRDFEPHLYVGTSSWIAGHVPAKKTDIWNNMAALPAAIPGRYLLLNEQETAGACLVHLRDKLFYASGRARRAQRARERLRAASIALPKSRRPGATIFCFCPGSTASAHPSKTRISAPRSSTIRSRTSVRNVIRAVLEGVALNTRWLFGHVERFFGRRVRELRLIGGGAESELWSRIFADVLDRRVLRVEKPQLSNLRGAGLIAWVGLGELGWDDVPSRVQLEQPIEPNASAPRRLRRALFASSRSSTERTRGTFTRMNRKEDST